MSQCPNTYSLSSLLATISACVEPAVTFTRSLQFVSQRYFPATVENNRVTLGNSNRIFERLLTRTFL